MNDPLLVTKIYLPRPRNPLIPRPALFARLDAGLAGTRILVSAPAGFGKTTLLSAWFERLNSTRINDTLPWGMAWLSLDRSDNDPARFWSYTIAALQTVEPGLAEPIRGALLTPSPPAKIHRWHWPGAGRAES